MIKKLENKKEQKMDIIVKSAKTYEKCLLNRNVLFIATNANNELILVETLFLKENFLHLSGVKVDKTKISAIDFFERAINGKLSIRDFSLNNDSFIDLKLKVLPMLVSIDVNANMIGDFNNNSLLLQTKKIAGNVRGCLGFIYYKKMNIFIPNTALNEDIRNITNNRNRIVAILKKNKTAKLYDNVTYIAKNINIFEILHNDMIKNKINFENLYSNNVTYNKILSNLLK